MLGEKQKVHEEILNNISNVTANTSTNVTNTSRNFVPKKMTFITRAEPSPMDQSAAILLPQLKAHSTTSHQDAQNRQIKLNRMFEKKSVDYSTTKKAVNNSFTITKDVNTMNFDGEAQSLLSSVQKSKTPLRERAETVMRNDQSFSKLGGYDYSTSRNDINTGVPTSVTDFQKLHKMLAGNHN